MAESIGILIVFFFILVFGFSFYSKIAETQYSSKRLEDLSKKAVDIAQIVAFFPEVKCSLGTEEEVIVTDVCIDKLKLKSAEQVILDNFDYYYDILIYANVVIYQIYPVVVPPEPNQWILYNRVPIDADDNEFYSRKTRIYIPVSLYDTIADSYAFGYMEIEVYSK